MKKLKSLTATLFFRYTFVMLTIWVCFFALALFEFSRAGQEEIDLELKSGAQQMLAVMRVLTDSKDQMRETAAEIAKYDSSRTHEGGDVDIRIYFQVWLGDELVFADREGTPIDPINNNYLSREELTDAKGNLWIAWAAVDPATQTKTRLLMEDPISISIDSGHLGIFILPLLVSVPFLLIPTWLVTRKSMEPLTAIGEEIDSRDDIDLNLLVSDGKYRELEPIVNAINRLMTRLSDRLAREKEFLSDAAHELKTPLAVIKAQSERITLMSAKTGSRSIEKADIASATNGLSQGVDRATHAIAQLISYSRLDAGDLSNEFVRINLGEFVAECLASLDGIASSRRVELVLHCVERVFHHTQRNAFAALIDNLTSNALKHAPPGSKIEVTISMSHEDIIIMVDDAGPGIPVEERERVFERFYRLPDSPADGSGLGLGIAERAVRIHYGHIELSTPESGCGLRVIVRLPS